MHLKFVQDNQKDLVIIDRILSGDILACRELANRHKDYAFTVAYRILGNREDAEEVAQDSFLRAFRSLESFNREAKFTTWFYRIVFNGAVGMKRKNRIVTQDLGETNPGEIEIVETADPLRQYEQKLYINQALNHLLPDDVVMITLFYLKEHSLEEIAHITGIPTNTAKVKLHRARKRLAEELQRVLKNEAQTLL